MTVRGFRLSSLSFSLSLSLPTTAKDDWNRNDVVLSTAAQT